MKSIKDQSYRGQLIWQVLLILFCLGATSLVYGQNISDDGWKKFGKDYWPTEPVRGGIFRSAAAKYVGMMNPNHWPISDFLTLGLMYEKLVNRDGTYRSSLPYLVESWEYLDSITAITKLQKGVKFHDGTDFNAHSMKFQIDWINDPQNGCWSRPYLKLLKSVEVVDDYTLKWHFKKPWAVFTGGVLSGIPGWVVSAEALKKDSMLKELEKLKRRVRSQKRKVEQAEKEVKKADKAKMEEAEERLKTATKSLTDLEGRIKELEEKTAGAKSTDFHPIGTGSYMFEEGRPGNYTLLKRNPNWWFGQHVGRPEMPYFDKIQVMVIPDQSIQLANLRAGKIDAMEIEKSMYEVVKNDPNLNVFLYPLNSVTGLRFNHARGPCQDIRVRKAISHAIDRQALITGTQFGMARIASCFYPENHWAHNPALKPVSYDPELSKKLLAEAGYAKGLTIHGYMVNLPIVVSSTTVVKAMLKKVGITWEVDFLEPVAADDRMKNLEYDLAQGGAAWIFDPDLMATNIYHPIGRFNFGRTKNEKAIALIEAGKTEMDEKKRQQIYYKLEEELYNNYEDVWLYWWMGLTALNKKVQGYNVKMRVKYWEGDVATHPLWFKDGK